MVLLPNYCHLYFILRYEQRLPFAVPHEVDLFGDMNSLNDVPALAITAGQGVFTKAELFTPLANPTHSISVIVAAVTGRVM